jgi:PAS domain S-box-containing protein
MNCERTERKDAMEQRHLQHKVYSGITDPDLLLQILDMLPTSIFVKDENLKFVFSNQAHCDLIGLPVEKLLGHSDADFYPPDEAVQFLARDQQVIESGEVNESEELATNQSGHTSPYLTRKSKITSTDGSVYLIGTNTNLTEIRRREEQHATLAKTVPVGIWQVDERCNTIYVNSRLLNYLGLEPGASPDASALRALGNDQLNFPSMPTRFETDLALPSGESRRMLVISSGWLSLANFGTRSAIVCVVDVTEITELKRINDEISRLNRELAENMQKLKDAQDEIVRRGRMSQLGQLTATVAHELRNPLGAVRTAVYLVERKIKDKGLGIEPQLQRINNGITRCDNIISQLLDFTRSKALQCELLDFDEWLIKTVEEEAGRLPPIVEVECSVGLGGHQVQFDPGRMNRVVINLLSNASEAMVGRGDDPSKIYTDKPKVKVTTDLTARGVELTVTDNGPGISSENMAKIMEPLFTTKNFGTGLGLPAIEKILDQHGGGLEIRSRVGEGATFIAWFPIRQASENAA